MERCAKLDTFKRLIGVSVSEYENDEQYGAYLDFAGKEIVNWLYSLVGIPSDAKVPESYEMIQVMACVAGYNLIGAENQNSHSENGVLRTFKYSDMVQYVHGNVVPYARV